MTAGSNPQEPTERQGKEHRKGMDGFWSSRCEYAVGGCDDLACVCTCHDMESFEFEEPADV